MRTQIFISYRRDGGLAAARRLYDELCDKYEVFFDMKSLRSGRFDLAIEAAIEGCSDFLLILSPRIFDRINEDGDWIRREVELALGMGKNLIPVFLDGFVYTKSDDELVSTVMLSNGISLSDPGYYERLLSFLKSNKRCVLPVECREGEYRLSPEAVDNLKEIYRSTVKHKDYRVQVDLALPEPRALAASRVGADAVGDERERLIINEMQPTVRRHRTRYDTVSLAIEYMISDRINIEAPMLWSALKGDALAGEYFIDGDGGIGSYLTVAAWVRITEELLLEFTVRDINRASHYRAMRDNYSAIDCFIPIVSREYREEWGFISVATKEECAALATPTGYTLKNSLFTLSAGTLLRTVLPDFYLKVAEELLNSRDEALKRELYDPESRIRSLEYYCYGMR